MEKEAPYFHLLSWEYLHPAVLHQGSCDYLPCFCHPSMQLEAKETMWLSPHGPGTGGRLSPKAAVSVFHLGFCHSDLMTELLLPVSIILSITLKPEALWLGPWGASGAGAGSRGRKFPALPGSLWNGNPILFTSLRREFGPFWAKQKSPTKALPY